MARYMRTDLGRGHSRLNPPAVVGAGISWHGPGVYLRTPSSPNQYNRRRARYALRPPRVVTQPEVFIARPPSITLAPSAWQTRKTEYRLSPPSVIGAGRVNPGLRVKLTSPASPNEQSRRQTISTLRGPVVVTVVVTEIFFGPKISLAVTRAAGQLRRRSLIHSKLRPPVVIGGGIAWHGPGLYLTRPSRGQAKSFLHPPAAITAAVVEAYYGPSVTLSPSRRLQAKSHLAPPAVIAGARVNPGLRVKLVFGQSRRGVANLFPPAVVTPVAVEVYYGPEVHFAPGRRGIAKSALHPPVIPPLAEPTRTSLAPQRRGVPHSVLRAPRVVFLAVELSGPKQTLAPSRRPVTRSELRPPSVLEVAVEVFFGPSTELAPSFRGQTSPVLRGPVVVTAAEVILYGLSLNLAYSRRGIAKSALHPPAVIGAGRVNPGLRIKLTFGRRGVAKSQLHPPAAFAVAAAEVYYGPQTPFSRIRPRRTLALLRPPEVINPDVAFDGPGILLTRSFRGRSKSLLRKPVVVTAVVVVYFGPQVTLRPQRRGQPKSFLRKPVVVAAAPAFRPVVPPWLTYSRRGRPTYFLSAPTRVFPFFARKIEISLAPQRRGAPHSFLRPPTVVRLAVEIYGPETWLSYSRRGRPQYRLEPPSVLGRAPFRGIEITLARIKPRPTVSLIKPPTVVRIPKADVLRVYLTYSRRGRPIYFQIPFTPGKAPFRPLQVHLTRISPRPTVALIRPPSVVGAGIVFPALRIYLVRIKHPPVQHFLRLTLVAFRRPEGDVCGFDIAGSFVCYLELPGSQVSGTQAAGSQITGSSRAGSTMTGSDNADSSVSGSDRKAT